MNDLGVSPEQLASWVQGLGEVAAEYAPPVLGGLGVLLVGWLVAKLVRNVLKRMLETARLDAAVEGTRIQGLLSAINKELTASVLVSRLAYWLLILATVNAASGIWGLTAVQDGLSAAAGYLPTGLSALAMFAGGTWLASTARQAVGALLREMRNPAAGMAESATEGGILLVVALVTLDMLGADLSFITSNITLLMGSVLVVVVFLCCWAMRAPAEQLVANYYLRRMLSVNDHVETKEHKGTILEFVPLGLLIRDAKGDEHFVPALSLLSGLRRRQALKPEDTGP